MIPNHWYAILDANEVKKGRPIGVTRMGEKLVLWRDSQGKITCLSDLCPHRGVQLSVGEVIGDCIQCPFHGFEFDSLGQCRLIPANGKQSTPPKAFKVKAYPVQEAYDMVYIWWGEPREKYPELPFFESIPDKECSYGTIQNHWANHYSRAIENQLDVVHLPFAHKTTIGRGNKTLVNGPVYNTQICGDGTYQLNIWFSNELDHGQNPLRLDQMPAPTTHPLLEFRFPNVWHNWLGDNLHIFAAFAPIDDENTMMYVRMYQKIVRIPVLRNLFNAISKIGNKVILDQDKRVVITQRPPATSLRMGEKLIPGDGPIIEYRRIRQALIETAQEKA